MKSIIVAIILTLVSSTLTSEPPNKNLVAGMTSIGLNQSKLLPLVMETILNVDAALSRTVTDIDHILQLNAPHLVPKLKQIVDQAVADVTRLDGSENVVTTQLLSRFESIVDHAVLNIELLADETESSAIKIHQKVQDFLMKIDNLKKPLINLISQEKSFENLIVEAKKVATQVLSDVQQSLLQTVRQLEELLKGHDETVEEVKKTIKDGVREAREIGTGAIMKVSGPDVVNGQMLGVFLEMIQNIQKVGLKSYEKIQMQIEFVQVMNGGLELDRIFKELGTQVRISLKPLTNLVEQVSTPLNTEN